jgi:signal transduction histidine kinase/CheY-like chemotaxis protein
LLSALLAAVTSASNGPHFTWLKSGSEKIAPAHREVTHTIYASHDAAKSCRTFPKLTLTFPAVPLSSQELRLDDIVIARHGAPDLSEIESIYGHLRVRCSQITRGGVLTWHIYSANSHFLRQVRPPTLVSGADWRYFFTVPGYLIGCGAAIVLMIFFLIFLPGKISPFHLWALVGSCLFLTVYTAACVPGPLGLSINALMAHKLLVTSVWMCLWCLFATLYINRLIPKPFFAFQSLLFGTTTIIAIVAQKSDAVFLGSCLSYIAVILGQVIAIIKLFTLRRRAEVPQRIFILLLASLSIYTVSITNDVAYLLGVSGNGFMTCPLGLTSCLLFNAILVNEKILQNLRQKEDAERQLLATKEFFSGVSNSVKILAHEMKRPFSLVRTTVDYLQERCTGTAAVDREELAIISGEIQRADVTVSSLIADVLLLAGRSEPRREHVEVARLINDCLAEVVGQMPCRDIRLYWSLQHRNCLYADPHQLQRVMANVLLNAAEAIGDRDGYIRIQSLQHTDDTLFISFENSGSYIEPENRERIFEFMVSIGKPSGTGIGLATSRKIVEAHGGTIACHSTLSPLSTTFRLQLPAGSARDASEIYLPKSFKEVLQHHSASKKAEHRFDDLRGEIAALSIKMGRPLRVSLLDDEGTYLGALERMLAGIDGEVCALTGHVSAQTLFDDIKRGETPDLLLCDIDIGDYAHDGYTVVEALRELGWRGKVVFHSNRPALHHEERVLAADAIFVSKPIGPDQLLRCIHSCIPRHPPKAADASDSSS